MDKAVFENFGQRVRQIRQKLGLKQKDFAQKIGIHPAYLSEIELGRANMSLNFYRNMYNVLGVNLEFLVSGDGDMFSGQPLPGEDGEPGERKLITIEDLIWYLRNSEFFKNSILAYSQRFKFENEDFIKKSLK